jgi:hypothetical protein
MNTLSQIGFIETELSYLLNKVMPSQEEALRIDELKSNLSLLKTKRFSLNKIYNLCKEHNFKAKIEKIYNDVYFSIYFKNTNFNIYNDEDCLLFKKLTNNVSYKETIDDKTTIYKSPPVFFGNYKNDKITKLSIPSFLYDNDVDIMNFLQRIFQSKTRDYKIDKIIS